MKLARGRRVDGKDGDKKVGRQGGTFNKKNPAITSEAVGKHSCQKNNAC